MRRFKPNETAAMAAVIQQGGAISVPTDTVYGVCCRADSAAAQEHLRDIKQRPKDKAFPIMVCSLAQIRSLAVVDVRAQKIIQAFLPGPATVILPKQAEVPAFVNGGMATLAIRMAPAGPLRDLIEQTGPLFMTSANLSGAPVCRSLDEIEKSCPGLDGMMEGATEFGQASTIIDCTGEQIRILRQGPITLAQIQAVLAR